MTIVWIKELRNCVPFYVFVDGKECGLIKRGEKLEVNCNRQTAELYFIPKAPRFFGWKALKLNVKLYDYASEIHLGVFAKVCSESQLHCTFLIGAEITAGEYIKKYDDLLNSLR